MTDTKPLRAIRASTPVPPPAGARIIRRLFQAASLDLGPLRAHRDFRLFFGGQIISHFGNMLTIVASMYQVFALTHSSLAVGLFGIVVFVPVLLFSLVGGAFADVFDRRKLVQFTELALASLSCALLINALQPAPQLWLLYLVGALAAVLSSLQRPSLSALLTRLVERDEIVAAVVLTKALQSVGQIVGPAIAGLLIASVGLPLAYGVDVATFVVSVLALRLMQAVPPPTNAERLSLRSVREGLRFLRGYPLLYGTYLVDITATFFGWPFALLPALAVIYAREQSAIPAASTLGILYAAPATGALLASLTSGWTRRVHRHGRGVILAVIAWGMAVTGLGLAASLPLAFACLMLVGGANMISGVFRGAIANQTIPDALRGRLGGIEVIAYSTGPLLGDLEGGAVASAFTPQFAVFSGGILCILGVCLLVLVLPQVRRYDNRNPPLDSQATAANARMVEQRDRERLQ